MQKNVVITFHVVQDAAWFENVILLLKQNFNFIDADTLSQLYESKSSRKGTCHISFDDGDMSFITKALPVLVKHRVPATIFLCPEILMERKNLWHLEMAGFNKEQFLATIGSLYKYKTEELRKFDMVTIMKCFTSDQIWNIINVYKKTYHIRSEIPKYIDWKLLPQLLESNLVTVGGHTVNHPILHNENDAISRFETMGSIRELEKLTDRAIKYFAYPNGIPGVDFDDREKRYLNEAGVKLAFSTRGAYYNFSSMDPFSIPRIGLTSGSMNFISKKLKNIYLWNTLKMIRGNTEWQKRKRIEQVLRRA